MNSSAPLSSPSQTQGARARPLRRWLGKVWRKIEPLVGGAVARVALRRARAQFRNPAAAGSQAISDASAETERPKVLILTPVKDAVRHLPRYLDNLARLDYPPECLSLAFLESDSTDGSHEALAACLPELRARFARVELFKRDFHYRLPDGVPRWAPEVQLQRRSILARSRNSLLSHALRDEAWVLWVDVDLHSYPADVLDRLLAVGRQIVVPNCVVEPGGRTFDLNTFQLADRPPEEAAARTLRDGLQQPAAGEGRRYLHDLRAHELVPVDAVGGTMLLIDAELHRDGLIFPSFAYKQYIETEGLAVMARDMGVTSWGLPNLEIVHR